MIRTNLLLAGDDGYNLTKSLRFRSSASASLSRTFSTPTNNIKYTWSGWVKRGNLSVEQGLFCQYTSATDSVELKFLSTGELKCYVAIPGSIDYSRQTVQVFRDPSAWYHIIFVYDSANATSDDRIIFYVNGIRVTNFTDPDGTIVQNCASAINISGRTHYLGYRGASTQYLDGYMAELNFIDGQALTPSSFGSTNALTGVWQPAKYTGTYGTNGFYLPFTNTTSTSTLGNDFSGNSNTWTVNNISLTTGSTYDSMNDVPTLTSATTANYCTLNPLNASSVGAANNANLQAYSTSGANTGAAGINGTIALPTTGLYYFEVTMSAVSNAGVAGIAKLGATQDTNFGAGAYANIYAYTNTSGVAYANNATAYTGSTLTTGDILGVAVDMTNGALYFAKNNTWQNSGVPTSGASKTGAISFTVTSDLLPTCYAWKNSGADALSANFGQRPFSYTAPTGFVALNTFNLPTSTIVKGNTVMDATIWSGDNTTPRSIVNAASFKPDFVWLKSRSNAYQHNLYDSVRGAGAAYALSSDQTAAEGGNSSTYGYLSAFNSTGFQVTQGSAGGGGAPNGNAYTNQTSTTYVGWQWQAGQGSTSSNTSGSITSTVSVNATAGFSVVTYTGTSSAVTVGHGLGVAPALIFVKGRGAVDNWGVYSSSFSAPANDYLVLNSTAAKGTVTNFWGGTATSSVFYFGAGFGSGNFVAYCWSEIAGFSKFGSYTGNGSTDGPFVYTGFRPKFVMIKRSDSTSDWFMWDTSRSPYNAVSVELYANASAAEASSGSNPDILSNGFKLRLSNPDRNASGGTYIYMAFAENPFKNALAR